MTVDELIEKWWGRKGGAERSNFSPFIHDLCDALGLPQPGIAEAGHLGDYEFEGTVPSGSFRSLKASGYIDLYKKGCFVMEAKQSQLPAERQADLGLFEPAPTAPQAPSGARYDRLMQDARAQAENYAKNLPGDHPPVPFILVCDVGRAFEIEFDYTGNGRGYGFFPDKQSYRIELPDLRRPEIADRLRAIWTNPDSINPRFQSAEVTRLIAQRLAEVSKWLEETQRQKTAGKSDWERSLAVEETALFLMRLLFCMFAEDIGLLPEHKFEEFLERSLTDEEHFESGLSEIWRLMADGHTENRYVLALQGRVRYFNGKLFETRTIYRLGRAAQGELLAAARHNWKKVEPAIFGTLLEQALTKEERAKLGAHYTPRPYVERLVQATIMDVLEAEWAEAQSPSPSGEGTEVGESGETTQTLPDDHTGPTPNPSPEGEGLKRAIAFHDRLASLRILDPACGTGNFLYVAMEAMQTLESRVIERIQQLGGAAKAKLGPHQFFGLELNPRAAKIAELVLWIGWLRFRIANEPGDIGDPVLASTASINFGRHGGYDAVLRQKETGEPDLDNPMPPEWPEADFIIGNPPFIGGKDIRSTLGSGYAEAVWRANPRVAPSADFVMQWWDRAALILTQPNSRLKRFGFVTTNSITQEFSRRVIQRYLSSAQEVSRLSLVYGVPDHPWTKATKDSAAVRIAMTVAEVGEHLGQFVEVVGEAKLDTDTPELRLSESEAGIRANLSIGTDLGSVEPLAANGHISSRGVQLMGAGFIVTPSEATALGLGRREGLEKYIRPYLNGRDLLQRSRDALVIDLFGLSESEVRQRFPEVYERLLRTVREGRAKQAAKSPTADAKAYLATFWIFGKPRKELRAAVADLPCFIVTVETAKHRVFQFLDADILPDNKLVAIGSSDAFQLGVLSSQAHLQWTYANCGLLGVASFDAGHVYVKSNIFDPFPFPDATSDHRAEIAALAEELDATRKAVLAEVPGLTMTELYNLREWVRKSSPERGGGSPSGLTEGAPSTTRSAGGPPPRSGEDLQDRATRARAGIVNRLHEQIDAAVAAAYGWPADLSPSEIVARLVALNAERAAEEKAGKVRWLRPEYQEPRFGAKAGKT